MPGLRELSRTLVLVIALFAPVCVAGQTLASGQTAGPATPVSEAVKAAEANRDSLVEMVKAYEQEAGKLAEKNAQLKDLYSHGDISRNEMEAADKALAEARARVEDTREQVKEAEAAIAAAVEAAKNPPALESPSSAAAETYVATRGAEVSWTTGNRQTDALIRFYGGRYGVDPYLIFCVMRQESGFRTTATSHAGAQGLMQLMPATAARFGVTNPYDPAQNIQAGTRYLKFLLDLFKGRVDLALAGYNAGEGAVKKYGNRVPPYAETQAYVRAIGARYAQGGRLTLTAKISARKSD
jgi:soluble lytic murein transglycosylase-like protein